MESSQVKNILSKYLTVEKNVDIFSKHIARVGDEDLLDQILFELCVDLNAKKSIKECYKKLVSGAYAYGEKAFEKFRISQQEQDDFVTSPAEVEEGVLECKCGSKRTISFTLQTRSGDEGTSVWARCVECGNKWQA